MQFSREGKIGIALTLGFGLGAGAMMVFPTHHEIGWALMGLSGVGLLLLGAHHFLAKGRRSPNDGGISAGRDNTGIQAVVHGRAALSQGGQGGGVIVGDNSIGVGGAGGHAGGLPGFGGTGGSGGVGDIVAGGEGGSVDGAGILYPPARSGFEVGQDELGPDVFRTWPVPGVRKFGRGGMSPRYAEVFCVVDAIRVTYFKMFNKPYEDAIDNVWAVPLDYVNAQLEKAHSPWRARILHNDYLFYDPSKS